MNLPLLVFAGNQRQFQYFCEQRGLKPSLDAQYISKPEDLRGHRDRRYVVWGTWLDTGISKDDHFPIFTRQNQEVDSAELPRLVDLGRPTPKWLFQKPAPIRSAPGGEWDIPAQVDIVGELPDEQNAPDVNPGTPCHTRCLPDNNSPSRRFATSRKPSQGLRPGKSRLLLWSSPSEAGG